MNKKRDWFGILFGTIWFLASLLILVLYMTGKLNGSIPVPKVLLIVYEKLGIVPGAIVQMVLSALLFIFSVRKREN